MGNPMPISLAQGCENGDEQVSPASAIDLLDRISNPSTGSIKRPREDEPTGQDDVEWQTVVRPSKKKKRTPTKASSRYPTITLSAKLKQNAIVKISEVRDLVLYILADGSAPSNFTVSHRREVNKVVVVMVAGLEEAMFLPHVDLVTFNQQQQAAADLSLRGSNTVPRTEHRGPLSLDHDTLAAPLKPFATLFPQRFPVRAPGDDRQTKIHSPIAALLTSPVPKSAAKSGTAAVARESIGWEDQRTRITEFLASSDELQDNGFLVHPALLPDESRRSCIIPDGWVLSRVDNVESGQVPEAEIEAGSVTAGRQILALDCEMCMTGPTDFALTRISIIDWAGDEIMDELVKPDQPITDYVTKFSGITAEMLEPVETKLSDIQARLLSLLTPNTILIGHSLESDLKALRMSHPFIVDTSLLYPHLRGPPIKSSLKFLSQKYLSREIQKGHGSGGHNSIEDARACLDLVRLKCEKGKLWGAGDAQGENVFRRIGRAGSALQSDGNNRPTSGVEAGKTSAAIDWGEPEKGPGVSATHRISCDSDDAVVAGVIRAVQGDPDGLEIRSGGVDFVWARMRELEARQGWWNRNRDGFLDDALNKALSIAGKLEDCLTSVAARLLRIHEALPACSVMIVLSGTGDPRPMARIQAMHAVFQHEYRTLRKEWDDLSVKWTDEDEQELHQAVSLARLGMGFVAVK